MTRKASGGGSEATMKAVVYAPEAIRYLETGHARGKIVITVSGASQMTQDTSPN